MFTKIIARPYTLNLIKGKESDYIVNVYAKVNEDLTNEYKDYFIHSTATKVLPNGIFLEVFYLNHKDLKMKKDIELQRQPEVLPEEQGNDSLIRDIKI